MATPLLRVQDVKTLTLSALAGFLVSTSFCANLSPRQIIEQSITNYEKDWNAALDYQYDQRDVTMDAEGKSKSVEVSHVSVLQGTPYSRLTTRDGHPLSPEEVRKENEKYQKAVSTRDSESPEQRQKRVNKYQNERQFLHEIPDAFDIQLIGRETLNDRLNYVLHLTPKAGYVPKAKNARMFSDIEGKLWVDQQDLRWSKAEAEVNDTIAIGWVLARIGPGAHITFEQVKVDGDHWMPKQINVDGIARILLVKNRAINQTISYSNYKPVAPAPTGVSAKMR